MSDVLDRLHDWWFSKGRPHRNRCVWASLQELFYSVQVHDERFDRVLSTMAKLYAEAYAEGQKHPLVPIEGERSTEHQIIKDLYEVNGWLMKGIGHISVPDYEKLNLAMLAAQMYLAPDQKDEDE